jgi:GTP pyrophosphokinase
VVGPENKAVEIQIRTQQMHDHAELGVAAHWRYKEGGGSNAEFERKINWMRQLLDQGHTEDVGQDLALIQGFSTALLDDHAYVLTPKGEVIELGQGGTVLDFAYLVHTSVGHRCRGAKVNGRIVPMTHKPKSGDQIEILTGKLAEPNRNWLDPNQGYLGTPRARGKVRAYFNQLDLQQNISAGRDIVEKECKRLGVSDFPFEFLAHHFHLKKTDDFLIQMALGDLTLGQLARALHEYTAPKTPEPAATSKLKQGTVKAVKTKAPKMSSDAVLIDGVGNLMVSMANCCKPLMGDAITGFITRGRGLSVHRSDCKDLIHLADQESARVVEVQWGKAVHQRFRVVVQVSAFDRNGLLRDVGAVFAEANVSILGASTKTDPIEGTADMNYTLEVADFSELSSLLAKLRALPNVFEARRV